MIRKRDNTSATNAMSRRFRRRIGRVPLALLALLVLALTVPVRQAGGQGVVIFNNRIAGGAGVGLTLHIWGPSTNNPALALIGLGFERLLMFLTGVSNIRDVIPFARTPGNAEF